MTTKATIGVRLTRYLAGPAVAAGLAIGLAAAANAEPTGNTDPQQHCAGADSTCVNTEVSRVQPAEAGPMPKPLPRPRPCIPIISPCLPPPVVDAR